MNTTNKSINPVNIFAILGLVSLGSGLVILLLFPELIISALLILSIGIILLVIAFFIDFKRYSKALTSHRGRLNTGTVFMTSIFLGIIILINAISTLYYHRFDTSSLSQFTLTPQTVKVLTDLKTPLKTTGFFIPEDPYNIGNYIKILLDEYQNKSRQINVQIIDPDQHPDQAKKYEITEYQTVVFESGKKRRLVPPSRFVMVDESGKPIGVKAEHSFTSAILEVTGIVQKHVYFLTGHGEADIESKFQKVKEGLLDDLYLVDELNLKTNPEIPDDCAVLVIAAPRKELSINELKIFFTYLLKGGQTLILTDPGSKSNLISSLKAWGIEVADGTIIDPASSVAPNKDMPLVPSDRNYFLLPEVYFPGAAAIIPQENLPGSIQVMPLVYTDKSSWLDKNFETGKEPVFNPDIEKMESLAIGVMVVKSPSASSAKNKFTRVIVIGDSDFVSNSHFSNANNGDLFLNSINWLAEETSLISIRRNVQPFRRLVITQGQTYFIKYSSVALLPFIFLIIAGIIWWRRR